MPTSSPQISIEPISVEGDFSIETLISVQPLDIDHSLSFDSTISVKPISGCEFIPPHQGLSRSNSNASITSNFQNSPPQEVTQTPTLCDISSPLQFKRVKRCVSATKFGILTGEMCIANDLRKTCCNLMCLQKFGKKCLTRIRIHYFSLDGNEQDAFLDAYMQLKQEGRSRKDVGFRYYLNNQTECCRKAFKIVFCLGNTRLARLQERILHGTDDYDERYAVKYTRCLNANVLSWMKEYFTWNCEVMPTTGRLHLGDNYTRKDVFNAYQSDMRNGGQHYVKYAQFTRIWRHQFDNVVIPPKVRMGVCSICANLKSLIKGSKTELEKRDAQDALKEHRKAQALERKRSQHHRQKSIADSSNYLTLMIDGMDQKKTCLPHFSRVPKDVSDDAFVQMHLVGCLMYSGCVYPYVFLTYPNVHNDPNLTITIIHKVLLGWKQPLPPCLYVQLDNTARENKNASVFAYLSMLVQMDIFKKVKVNFLMVGHTHDHIDQMFSTFSKRLARHDAFTMPALIEVISKAYSPCPIIEHLHEIIDFKRFIFGDNLKRERCMTKLNNISFNHVFLMRKADSNGNVLLFAKQFSTTKDWEPAQGCHFLLFVPQGQMFAAQQEPLEVKSLKLASSPIQEDDLWKAIEQKMVLLDNAKKYAGSQDTTWWNAFFHDQKEITRKYIAREWEMVVTFIWPSRERHLFEQSNFEIDNPTLQAMLNPERRDIYVGPRQSRVRQAAIKAMWNGDIQEIQVGTMVATLAEGDDMGRPFWIGKVISIHTNENNSKIDSIKVHWYRTTSQDAFTGRYVPEMIDVVAPRKRKRNARSVADLSLDEVDVILYDFALTKAGYLRKQTINMLKEKIYGSAIEGTCSKMMTRNDTASLQMHGLHVDEDNAIVDSAEEDESYNSCSGSTSISDDSGVNPEDDSS